MTQVSLEGRTALVTGATGGVGRAIATAIARQGATVILTGRDPDRLDRVTSEIREAGGHARCVAADLTVDGGLRALHDSAVAVSDSLEVLVHCAGTIVPGAMESADPALLDAQLAVNLRAPFVLTRSLLPLLKAGNGDVVFVNSTAGLTAAAGAAAYAASKHGLRGFADTLRAEVNRDGIRVLSLFLGRTATPMQKAVHEYEDRAYHPDRLVQPDDVAEVVMAALTLPRTAEVTEIRMRPALKPDEGARRG